MIVFTCGKQAICNSRTIALFGVGLIGSSISKAIQSTLSMNRQVLPYVWNDQSVQAQQIKNIQKIITDTLRGKPHTIFDLVWSAGRSGFTSSTEETALELNNYKAVISMAQKIGKQFPMQVRGVHLISSAGGLFLGQPFVTSQTEPMPTIPYGQLKMNQEKFLLKLQGMYCTYVYRLSTVYGTIKAGQRRGLITTLLSNGVQHKISYITGRMTTLRDFIYVEDVARFVLSKLINHSSLKNNSFMLVSGKPTTIQEIKTIVENVIKHKIHLNYLLNPPNEQDIIFSPTVIPKYWQPAWLRHTIPSIYRKALASGELFLESG